MTTSRPGVAELISHGKAPPPGFVARLLARHELIEWDRLVLGPETAGRSEVRDAALGGNAGTGERNHDFGFAYQIVETCHCRIQVGRDHLSNPERIVLQ